MKRKSARFDIVLPGLLSVIELRLLPVSFPAEWGAAAMIHLLSFIVGVSGREGVLALPGYEYPNRLGERLRKDQEPGRVPLPGGRAENAVA